MGSGVWKGQVGGRESGLPLEVGAPEWVERKAWASSKGVCSSLAGLRSPVGHMRCAAGQGMWEELTWPQPGPPVDKGSAGIWGAEETQVPSLDRMPQWAILLTILTH